MHAMAITIEAANGPTDEGRALITGLEGELSPHYAPEQRHGLSFEAIFRPDIRFFLARLDGVAVGCGGIALCDGFAEVKRMYVRPEARGLGVADRLVARLAQEARDAGRTLLRLETGIHQTAALRFYERLGFAACGAFEPYAAMPPDTISTSVFMEMPLQA
jgi:putative acetyltransferase